VTAGSGDNEMRVINELDDDFVGVPRSQIGCGDGGIDPPTILGC